MDTKKEYGKNRYRNMSKEDKQKLEKLSQLKKIILFVSYVLYKRWAKIIGLGNIEIKNGKFHCLNHSDDIDNVNIDKIKISNKFCFGKKSFKYIIGYKDDDKIKPLCIILSWYAKSFVILNICPFWLRGWVVKKI